ncbi:hypothetical protein MB27_31870 [Actinoplanes utahensis]|uniref:Uncharacterized protein n=1 Tax=Actinoplanes utahensis TaxID=1869 RepID=A0A0A6UFR5_ACTUT|nr:hypothetical protein MB27_31870 [Actinoplanes utahensis]
MADPLHPRHRAGYGDGPGGVEKLASQWLVEFELGEVETGGFRSSAPTEGGTQGKAALTQANEDVDGRAAGTAHKP